MNSKFIPNPGQLIEELPHYEEACELVATLATMHVHSDEEITSGDLSYGLLRVLAALHDEIPQDLRYSIAIAAAVLIVRDIPDDMKKQVLDNDLPITLN